MVRRGDECVVLWPRYFDARRSRAAGRRVSKDLAVRDPDLKWLASATSKAGFAHDVEEDARDPALPWKKCGRIVVKQKGGKEAIIRAVAKQMAHSSA